MEKNFYYCEKCGNIITFMGEKKNDVVCCEEAMKELVPGSIDASLEKHVPAIYDNDENIVVVVGEVTHPMEEDHYIEWIMLESKEETLITYLKPGDEPKAVYPYIKGSTVYAYCNKHGLWKKEVN